MLPQMQKCVRVTSVLVRAAERRIAVANCASSVRAMSSSSSPSDTSNNPFPGGVQFKPREMTEELVRKIGETDAAMRAAYDRVPEKFPEHAQAKGETPLDQHSAFRKRLVYRAKQRGW
jgi:hypothetical protein